MNKTIIAISLIAAMSSTNSFAAEAVADYEASKQDAGLGIGLLAGALVGGPVGFVVGGLIGSQLGQAEEYKQQLTEKDQQLAALRKDIALAKANTPVKHNPQHFHNTAANNHKVSRALATGMRVDVLYRTNSENIEPHYHSQLQRVIAVMKLFPEVDIQLAGHADPRGPENANLALSRRRIDSIRQALIQAGIKTQRIHARAWGEDNTISTQKDIEAYAFDRRVVINFINKSSRNNKAAIRDDARPPAANLVPVSLQP